MQTNFNSKGKFEKKKTITINVKCISCRDTGRITKSVFLKKGVCGICGGKLIEIKKG